MNLTKTAPSRATGEEKTMTSREIAAVVEKRHDNVKRTIETLASKGIFTLPQIEETSFLDSAGKKQRTTEYRVCKRDSYVIVAQLSPEFTARLVDRWQELEAQQAPAPRELTRMELIRIAMEAEQERLALAAQVEEMQPTVAAYDRLTNADNTFCVRDAAKQLNLKPSKLTDWLSSNDWIFKHGSSSTWAAYQARIDAGLMIQKTTVIERGGETSLYSQARITAKGLATISKTIEKANRTVKQLAA